jgi:hypothetical protein
MTNQANSSSTNTVNSTEGGVVVTITNKLSVSVDIYDVFNSGTSGQVVPFTYTKLGTIAAGASSTVKTIRNVAMLEAMYTGTIKELDNKYYYQFPIKYMSGTQLSFGTPPPLAYTIEESDRTANIQSFLFHKFAMANPSSALTSSLNTAIKTGKSDTINAFFAGTQNFKVCTLASWNAIMTWLQQFTSGWQGPYYMYEKAPSPLPKDYIPTLVCTINILSDATTNSATLQVCGTDASGNPIYATPPQTTTINMAGDGTMVDSNPGADVSLQLTPVFMNVIQSTMQNGVPVPSYLVGTALCGTIMGKEVVSSQTARQIPGKPADPKKAGFFDSLFGSASSTLSTLVGLIMLYEFLTKKTNENQAEKETSKSEASSQAELEASDTSIDDNSASEISSELTSASSTETFNSASEVQQGYNEASGALQSETMTQSMNEQVESINSEIQDQLNNGETPTPEFETAYSDMQTSFESAQKSIESGDYTAANTSIQEASTGIETAITTNGAEMAEWESTALTDSATALNEATSASDAIDKAQETTDSERANEAEDSGFDAEDATPDVDPIEI